MNSRTVVNAVGGLVVAGVFASAGYAQQGVGEKVGETLDKVGRGIRHEAQVVSEAVRKRFDAMREDVHGMGVQSRVYSRVHWDRALNASKVEVHVIRNGVVVLRGAVPDQAAKDRAVALTRDTMGVTEVFDELVPLTVPAETVPRSS